MTAANKQAPRPAATILLLREAVAATEVFMLQRTASAVFLPGAFVFPGGALDPDDASERAARRMRGLDDAQASARLGIPSGGLAYWVAAARECFEEAGILLARDEKDAPVDPDRAASFEHLREPMNAGPILFSDFLEKENLYIPAQEIAYYSHWITAPGRPRRFSTRFFVACAPAGQQGAHDRSETVHSVWVSPREALERGQRKEITRFRFNEWIESLIQRGRNPGQAVPIVLTSHDTTEARMRGALGRIAALPAVLEPPRMIRIERS